MTSKKIFRFFLVLLWLIIIFLFSNQPGNISSKESEDVVTAVVEVISNKDEGTKEQIVKNYTYLTRKIAHFLEFFILSILLVRFLSLFRIKLKNLIVICIIICLLVSIGDEVHQSFIPDRDSNSIDVLIDTSGSLLGLGVFIFLDNHKKK